MEMVALEALDKDDLIKFRAINKNHMYTNSPLARLCVEDG
jgi:hypothetical protein